MKCRRLNRKDHTTRRWHRLWCRECQNAQEVDALIGFGVMQLHDTPFAPQGLADTLGQLDLTGGGRHVRHAARQIGRRWVRRQAQKAGVALAAGALWLSYMNYTPALHIPPKAQPPINAITYFKAAGSKVVHPKEIDKALTPPDPTADRRPNNTVAQVHVDKNGKRSLGMRVFNGAEYAVSMENRLWLLNENRDALAALREGLKYPYEETYMHNWNTTFPYYAQFRGLARLLRLEAEVKSEQGDWNGAMQSSLDAMQMGSEMPHGAPLIGLLVGIACEAVGRQTAWKAVQHLDARQTRAAIARLEQIRARHAPYADTLQEEEWCMVGNLRQEMRDTNWRLDWLRQIRSNSDSIWSGLALYGWSNRVILNDIAGYMDKTVVRSRLPYALQKTLPPVQEPPFDPIFQVIFPVFANAQYQDVYGSQTQDALLVTALALRAYYLEKGAYPDNLPQLVPHYLAQVPADPFAQKALLSYFKLPPKAAQEKAGKDKQDGKSEANLLGPVPYVLYSVGPDGQGDGGDPVDKWHRPPSGSTPAPAWNTNSPRFAVQPDSRGDIVAGLNMR